ncbi:MAG: poly-gamma-glutamate synthase PgsB, partial [Candidatus Limnocylindrales bacterium]
REGGFITIAKTTGSAARVILPSGEELPIVRRGAATINEQVDIIERFVTPDVEALVVECMAVNPIYQRYAQETIVRSDVTIITNVRYDHQELMGETLEQIADSMSVTIPAGGVLITAEERPALRQRLAENAGRRGATVRFADADSVTDADMAGFEYVEFRANVAIGFELADLLGIEREVALRGMWKTVPDIGALRLSSFEIRGKDVLWVPLFAANDRESVVSILEMLKPQLSGRATIGVLNNRADRGRRAQLFAEMAAGELMPFLDHVITFGAFERLVTDQMVARGFPAARITNLGDSVEPTLDDILDTVARLLPGQRGALIGLVNIHTPQAEMLLHHVSGAAPDADPEAAELAMSRESRRLPRAVRRHRSAVARTARPVPVLDDA